MTNAGATIFFLIFFIISFIFTVVAWYLDYENRKKRYFYEGKDDTLKYLKWVFVFITIIVLMLVLIFGLKTIEDWWNSIFTF